MSKPHPLVDDNWLFRDVITVIKSKYIQINLRMVPSYTDCSPPMGHFLLVAPATQILFTQGHAHAFTALCFPITIMYRRPQWSRWFRVHRSVEEETTRSKTLY